MAEEVNAIESFATEFEGKVYLPGDPDYDGLRKIWNGEIDRKPSLVACCLDADQAASAIRLARDRRLKIAVRGEATMMLAWLCRLRRRVDDWPWQDVPCDGRYDDAPGIVRQGDLGRC